MIDWIVSSESNLSSVIITPDPIIPHLSSGNQNFVSQLITSFARQLNQKSLGDARSSHLTVSSLFVSSSSSSIDHQHDNNLYAQLRESLIRFTRNLTIATPDSIQLQASALVHLTQSTHQLTRNTAVRLLQSHASLIIVLRFYQWIASERCLELARSLHSMSARISSEDAQRAVRWIAQCTSNIHTVRFHL